MRGGDHQPDAMFSYVSMEDRIPPDHPLRAMRGLMDAALREMSPRFKLMYEEYLLGGDIITAINGDGYPLSLNFRA